MWSSYKTLHQAEFLRHVKITKEKVVSVCYGSVVRDYCLLSFYHFVNTRSIHLYRQCIINCFAHKLVYSNSHTEWCLQPMTNQPTTRLTAVMQVNLLWHCWLAVRKSKRWWGFGDGSGISWTICKQSAPHPRQITRPTHHHSVFTGRMLFLPPSHWCYY